MDKRNMISESILKRQIAASRKAIRRLERLRSLQATREALNIKHDELVVKVYADNR